MRALREAGGPGNRRDHEVSREEAVVESQAMDGRGKVR
ncbi:MAG: hypothetical protein OJF61_002390 [Rhodanobacteraceae bacterium]|nr:MAG: hypothetical protein OJF61_002390 [Rhodanobacteraceae bacterium]